MSSRWVTPSVAPVHLRADDAEEYYAYRGRPGSYEVGMGGGVVAARSNVATSPVMDARERQYVHESVVASSGRRGSGYYDYHTVGFGDGGRRREPLVDSQTPTPRGRAATPSSAGWSQNGAFGGPRSTTPTGGGSTWRNVPPDSTTGGGVYHAPPHASYLGGNDGSPRHAHGSGGYSWEEMDAPSTYTTTTASPGRNSPMRAGAGGHGDASASGSRSAAGYEVEGRGRPTAVTPIRRHLSYEDDLRTSDVHGGVTSSAYLMDQGYRVPLNSSVPTSQRGGPIMRGSAGPRRTPSMVKDPCSTFLPPVSLQDVDRLCLVLDLDETLVYARHGPVSIRPFVADFLRDLASADVEVVLWTAGEREYAQTVIRQIDPHGVIQHCVYRHSKWWTGVPGYAKNLRALGRNLSRTLMIENTPDCLKEQPDNGLLVRDYTGGSHDTTFRAIQEVVHDLVARRHLSVPVVLSSHPAVKPTHVDCDNGGSIQTFVLTGDAAALSSQGMMHAGAVARYNRDWVPAAIADRGKSRSMTPTSSARAPRQPGAYLRY